MDTEKQLWLALKEDQSVEDHPRVAGLMREGWEFAQEMERRWMPGTLERVLWIIRMRRTKNA